jgi:hypothetical protein
MDDLSLEAIECPKPDGGLVSPSDRNTVIALLTLPEDELDLAGPALDQRGHLGAVAGWDGISTGAVALR